MNVKEGPAQVAGRKRYNLSGAAAGGDGEEETGNMLEQDQVEAGVKLARGIVDNIENVIFGKDDVVRLVVATLIADGHALIEDVPGTGKTSLVRALANSIDCSFSRIQFTPDVMPSDITGYSVFNQKTREFDFRTGGVHACIVLADEINRASAKTQSAMLEAMEERQVTVDGVTRPLPEPFMVLATQNPVEQYGTYPLPEAQVDRFMIKLNMGYPDFAKEVSILRRPHGARKDLTCVATGADVMDLRQLARQVHASDEVCTYIVQLVTATRGSAEVTLGSSPRGGLATLALCRAWALLDGRGYVTPDDVKALVPYTLAHRIHLTPEARSQGVTEHDVVSSVLARVAVPVATEGAR